MHRGKNGNLLDFYKGKTILITGHTGFKGSWLCQILINAGAKVIGYSLKPDTKPSLFKLLELDDKMASILGDVRDYQHLKNIFDTYKPEIVFHLAAQPIVRESYKNPLYTYETNVIGTVNVCECIRNCSSVKSFLNVTTDKVYENNDIPNYKFKEDDKLDGFDPYSNSKSCSEILTHSYYKSFFKDLNIAVSTARAGNVIGGGDFSKDRIVPDAFAAFSKGKILSIRNPLSIRPYQFVLEPLFCYLLIAMVQYEDQLFSGSYNIGPDSTDCITTKELIDKIVSVTGNQFSYSFADKSGPHESSFLQLDNTKIKKKFGWKPAFDIDDAVKFTAEWYMAWINNQDIKEIVLKQINLYKEKFVWDVFWPKN